MKDIYRKITKGIIRLEQRANTISRSTLNPWQFIYCTSGLISDSWQLWNTFCMNILAISCQGCTGRKGHLYPARIVQDNSIERIAAEYDQYKNGNINPPPVGKRKTKYWQFPTWGDTKYITNVIIGLSTSNKNNLLTAFTIPLIGIEELQNLRNTLFHMEQQKIRDIATYYRNSYGIKFSHPAEVIFEIKNNTFIFSSWLNDMKHIILQATL